ncbi:MAG TPA: PmoA family protein, partial [Rhodothermales bacterium]|nr:PmoA family protein [Rhodothermales bacterium]
MKPIIRNALLLGAGAVLMLDVSACRQAATAGGDEAPGDVDPLMVELVRHDDAQRVDVLVGGEPFTSYVYTDTLPVLKKPVLYPIMTANGKAITRGFPLDPRPGERVDHPHHIGLWFNYGNVNGLDFWNNSDAIPADRADKMGTIREREIKTVQSGEGEGVLEAVSDWLEPDGKALLRENTRFVFHAYPGGKRAIDRITTLTALDQTVHFDDNKEGVLGLRVTRALEHPSHEPEVFTDASGKATEVAVLNNEGVTGHYRSSEGVEGEDVWGTRGRWVELSGVVEGDSVTVAILDHPQNVGFPTYWHARGYGLFAANPLGQKQLSGGKDELNYALPAGQSTTFRHRIV